MCLWKVLLSERIRINRICVSLFPYRIDHVDYKWYEIGSVYRFHVVLPHFSFFPCNCNLECGIFRRWARIPYLLAGAIQTICRHCSNNKSDCKLRYWWGLQQSFESVQLTERPSQQNISFQMRWSQAAAILATFLCWAHRCTYIYRGFFIANKCNSKVKIFYVATCVQWNLINKREKNEMKWARRIITG